MTCFFFFSSRRRHTRCSRDWSSDVCSSDLVVSRVHQVAPHKPRDAAHQRDELFLRIAHRLRDRPQPHPVPPDYCVHEPPCVPGDPQCKSRADDRPHQLCLSPSGRAPRHMAAPQKCCSPATDRASFGLETRYGLCRDGTSVLPLFHSTNRNRAPPSSRTMPRCSSSSLVPTM